MHSTLHSLSFNSTPFHPFIDRFLTKNSIHALCLPQTVSWVPVAKAVLWWMLLRPRECLAGYPVAICSHCSFWSFSPQPSRTPLVWDSIKKCKKEKTKCKNMQKWYRAIVIVHLCFHLLVELSMALSATCRGEVRHVGRGLVGDGRWKWHGGVLGPDGAIYGIPCNARRPRKTEGKRRRSKMFEFWNAFSKWEQRERVGLVNLGFLQCARVFWLSFLGKDFNI